MPFEVYTKRLVPIGLAPYVTIQRKGIFSLNAAAFEALGKPKAVELMYDAEEQMVGLRKVDTEVEHAYPVRGLGGKAESTFLISGMAFSKHYGLTVDTATRYPVKMIDDVLVIDLKVEGTDVTGPRGRPAKD